MKKQNKKSSDKPSPPPRTTPNQGQSVEKGSLSSHTKKGSDTSSDNKKN